MHLIIQRQNAETQEIRTPPCICPAPTGSELTRPAAFGGSFAFYRQTFIPSGTDTQTRHGGAQSEPET